MMTVAEVGDVWTRSGLRLVITRSKDSSVSTILSLTKVIEGAHCLLLHRLNSIVVEVLAS